MDAEQITSCVVTRFAMFMANVRGANEVVGRALTFPVPTITELESGVFRRFRALRRLAESSDNGVNFSIGFLARVVRALDEAGIAYTIDDRRSADPVHALDETVFRQLSPDDQQVANLLVSDTLLRVVVDSQKEAIHHTLLLCRLFPRSSFVIVGKPAAELSLLQDRIATQLGEQVEFFGRHTRTQRHRIAFTHGKTNWAFAAGPRPIVVALDAHELVTTGGQLALEILYRHNCPGRVLGFQCRKRIRRHPEFLLEEWFGAPCRVGRGPAPTIKFFFAPAPRFGRLRSPNALEFKRALIFCNASRNDRLASIAKAVAAHDRPKAAQLGLAELILDLNRRRKVTILVESLEHAKRMARRLPGWPIAALASGSGYGPAAEGLIQTIAHADAFGIGTRILICGTGGPDPLPPNCLHRPGVRSEMQLELIIDLSDSGRLADDTRNRARHYLRAGYREVKAVAARHQAGNALPGSTGVAGALGPNAVQTANGQAPMADPDQIPGPGLPELR